ncbi:MAG: hypothetical protein V1775_18315 [Bacteroidota bacterium]
MIKDDLKAIYDLLNSIPALKWVDEDFGQIDVYEVKPPVAFPCALVSLNQGADALAVDEYDLTNTFTVRVAHNRLGDRPAKSPEGALAITLAKLDDVDEVKTKLTGSGYYYQGLLSEKRTDGISVKALTFRQTI